MDKRTVVLKTDYLVPASADYIRAQIQTSVGVSTTASQRTSIVASELGRLLVHASTDATVGITLPVASDVTAYWSAVPGDVFTTTVLNTGTSAQAFADDSVLGVVATTGHGTIAAYLPTTFHYVVGGTVAIPTARAYIL